MRLEYNLRMIKEQTMSAFQLQAWIKVGELFNIENNIFWSYYSNYSSDYHCYWLKGNWVSSYDEHLNRMADILIQLLSFFLPVYVSFGRNISILLQSWACR